MAESLQQRLDSLRAKTSLLLERYRLLQQDHEAARQQIAELSRANELQRRELDKLGQQVEHLRVATALAPNHSDAEAARTFLSGLVREIDKCIAQLTQ